MATWLDLKQKSNYKDQSVKSKIVISAGIAEIQKPWIACAKHILAVWIPAIQLCLEGYAGKTLLLKRIYNQVEKCASFSTLTQVY
jgi:hypothetical protein